VRQRSSCFEISLWKAALRVSVAVSKRAPCFCLRNEDDDDEFMQCTCAAKVKWKRRRRRRERASERRSPSGSLQASWVSERAWYWFIMRYHDDEKRSIKPDPHQIGCCDKGNARAREQELKPAQCMHAYKCVCFMKRGMDERRAVYLAVCVCPAAAECHCFSWCAG